MNALLTTDLPYDNRRQGKVRDVYDVTLDSGEPALLIVATDRTSAFDVVMANGIPGKGIVLTQLAAFWFDHFADRVDHHLISTDVDVLPGLTASQRSLLNGRVMIGKRADVVPIECIARGYLTGSGWKDYQATGQLCGIDLPSGLRNSDKLAEPLFTPSTKAATGHDENISYADGCRVVGDSVMSALRSQTLMLYREAAGFAEERGIILADTKFEFGLVDGELLLIDEIFTPDSSRFWPLDDYEPGCEQDSFDKQIVRNYLEALVAEGEWDKSEPGVTLPDQVIERTLARYLEAFERLTGTGLSL